MPMVRVSTPNKHFFLFIRVFNTNEIPYLRYWPEKVHPNRIPKYGFEHVLSHLLFTPPELYYLTLVFLHPGKSYIFIHP